MEILTNKNSLIKHFKMKFCPIALFLTCFFLSSIVKGQELQWLNTFSPDVYLGSGIYTINKTSNGDYLLTAYEFFDKNYLLVYDADGEILKEDTLGTIPGQPLILEELAPDNYLIVDRNGAVYQLDLMNQSYELLFTLTFEDEAVDLRFGKTNSRILTLIGKQNIDTLASVHFKIDVDEPVVVEQYVSDSTLSSVALDYLTDGDLIEIFSPNIIRRTNAAKEVVWELSLPVTNSSINNIVVDTEDNIYLAGSQESENRSSALLAALDENGTLLWERILPPDSPTDQILYTFKDINRIALSADGGIIGVGGDGVAYDGPTSDVFVCKHDNNGELIWQMKYKVSGDGNNASRVLVDGEDIIATGLSNITDLIGLERGFILKLKDLSFMVKDTMVIDTTTHINHTLLLEEKFEFFPNPAQDYIQIKHQFLEGKNYSIELLNEQGQLLAAYKNTQWIAVNDLSAGKYMIKINADNFSFTKSWIKID